MARLKKLKQVVELEQAEEVLPVEAAVSSVTEAELLELNKGLSPLEVEEGVVSKKDVTINGKKFVEVLTKDGVTYLV
jgi:hypothetical protein